MSKRYRKILVAAALTALASMAIFASAANAATPAPPYQDFAGCPSEAENEFVAECVKYEFTGGHISFGNRDLPITNTIVLRGGFESVTGTFVFNNEGGIVPVRQTVPGGVIGMTGLKWLDEFSSKALKLSATVELAGQPGSITVPKFSVPVKLHLESPLLGKGCYVGSNSSPIALNLGVAQAPEELTPEEGRPEVLVGTGGVFTDSSYAVPAASGCNLEVGGISIPIDSLVDSAYKLPAAAGTNATSLDFDLSFVSPFVVYP